MSEPTVLTTDITLAARNRLFGCILTGSKMWRTNISRLQLGGAPSALGSDRPRALGVPSSRARKGPFVPHARRPIRCVGLNHLAQFTANQTRSGCIDFGELRWTPTRFGEIDLCTFRIRQKYRGGSHRSSQDCDSNPSRHQRPRVIILMTPAAMVTWASCSRSM